MTESVAATVNARRKSARSTIAILPQHREPSAYLRRDFPSKASQRAESAYPLISLANKSF
jgi:hypothetical protein